MSSYNEGPAIRELLSRSRAISKRMLRGKAAGVLGEELLNSRKEQVAEDVLQSREEFLQSVGLSLSNASFRKEINETAAAVEEVEGEIEKGENRKKMVAATLGVVKDVEENRKKMGSREAAFLPKNVSPRDHVDGESPRLLQRDVRRKSAEAKVPECNPRSDSNQQGKNAPFSNCCVSPRRGTMRPRDPWWHWVEHVPAGCIRVVPTIVASARGVLCWAAGNDRGCSEWKEALCKIEKFFLSARDEDSSQPPVALLKFRSRGSSPLSSCQVVPLRDWSEVKEALEDVALGIEPYGACVQAIVVDHNEAPTFFRSKMHFGASRQEMWILRSKHMYSSGIATHLCPMAGTGEGALECFSAEATRSLRYIEAASVGLARTLIRLASLSDKRCSLWTDWIYRDGVGDFEGFSLVEVRPVVNLDVKPADIPQCALPQSASCMLREVSRRSPRIEVAGADLKPRKPRPLVWRCSGEFCAGVHSLKVQPPHLMPQQDMLLAQNYQSSRGQQEYGSRRGRDCRTVQLCPTCYKKYMCELRNARPTTSSEAADIQTDGAGRAVDQLKPKPRGWKSRIQKEYEASLLMRGAFLSQLMEQSTEVNDGQRRHERLKRSDAAALKRAAQMSILEKAPLI